MSPQDQTTALYSTWLNLVSDFYRGMLSASMPAPQRPVAAAPASGEANAAVKPMMEAVGAAQQIFNQVFGVYAQMLSQAPGGAAMANVLTANIPNYQPGAGRPMPSPATAMPSPWFMPPSWPLPWGGAMPQAATIPPQAGAADQASDWLRLMSAPWTAINGLGSGLANGMWPVASAQGATQQSSPFDLLGPAGLPMMAQIWQSAAALPQLGPGLAMGQLNPLLEGMQQAFNPLADSFGLSPSRALKDAIQNLYTALQEQRRAQLDCLLLLNTIWVRIPDRVQERLKVMGEHGETVDSMLTLMRAWAKVADGAVHEAMQSEEGLQLLAANTRAATNVRQQMNRIVEIVSQAWNVPTRAEVDEAYREIQELKRRLRKLERDRLTIGDQDAQDK